MFNLYGQTVSYINWKRECDFFNLTSNSNNVYATVDVEADEESELESRTNPGALAALVDFEVGLE